MHINTDIRLIILVINFYRVFLKRSRTVVEETGKLNNKIKKKKKTKLDVGEFSAFVMKLHGRKQNKNNYTVQNNVQS